VRQPVPYGGFVRACGMSSLSPELFFRIRDGFIESRPMKGTVKRGRWLFEDEKNRAENVMIVDHFEDGFSHKAHGGFYHYRDHACE